MGRSPDASSRTFWRLLRLFPPIVVRLNARVPTAGKHRRWPSHAEIAITGQLTFDRVLEISELRSWSTVRIGEAERFCAACRFDPTNSHDRKRMSDLIRLCQKKHPNRPPQFLRTSPQWQTEILPLICLLRSSMAQSTASAKAVSTEQPSAA